VYSPWVWLYFTLTLALTAVVISGTWVLWRSKEKEIIRQGDESNTTKEHSVSMDA